MSENDLIILTSIGFLLLPALVMMFSGGPWVVKRGDKS